MWFYSQESAEGAVVIRVTSQVRKVQLECLLQSFVVSSGIFSKLWLCQCSWAWQNFAPVFKEHFLSIREKQFSIMFVELRWHCLLFVTSELWETYLTPRWLSVGSGGKSFINNQLLNAGTVHSAGGQICGRHSLPVLHRRGEGSMLSQVPGTWGGEVTLRIPGWFWGKRGTMLIWLSGRHSKASIPMPDAVLVHLSL